MNVARRARLAAVLAMVVAAVAVTAGSARAGLDAPGPVFDEDAVAWLSLRDQTSAQFDASLGAQRARGYQIVDLDIDAAGGDYRVGSVWQRNADDRDWDVLRDLTDTQFDAARLDESGRGMRLVEQETYEMAGVRRYAGVWVRNVEGVGWASYRSLTGAEVAQVIEEQRRDGRMPIDVDQYETAQGTRYSVVWVANTGGLAWALYRDLTSAGLSTRAAQYRGGYRMLAFDSVRTAEGQRYAGVWVENAHRRAWAERHDLTAQGYANWWHRYRDEGYRLVSYDRYQTAGGARYAGVWWQNSPRPDWAVKRAVDARMQRELDRTGVPGISVAVFQGGQAMYLRGFGYADIDDDIWMDSGHVGSIASVSKAVAGVLTMRMAEQGLVRLDQKTRDLVPGLPAQHTHTIGQLVSSRGCVGHYEEIATGGFADRPYPSALAAAERFWDEPLACTPPKYHYSTHSYTVLGAALEAAGGEDIEALVRGELTDAFGLGTLAPQDLAATGVRRMTIYTTDDVEVAIPNNDWKTLGGGLESSAYDLGRFGAELAAGHILTQRSLDTMWRPPDKRSDYAYGWNTGTQKGHRLVSKDGAWTGNLAYLGIYPRDGIVVAVMMNDRSGDQSAAQLGRDIGTLVLTSLRSR